MFSGLFNQGLLITQETVKEVLRWGIPIGVSIANVVILLNRDKKKDHEKKHKELKADCEKLIEKMSTSITKDIEDRDAANWRSHGEIRTEVETILSQSMKLVESMDRKLDILLGKKK